MQSVYNLFRDDYTTYVSRVEEAECSNDFSETFASFIYSGYRISRTNPDSNPSEQYTDSSESYHR